MQGPAFLESVDLTKLGAKWVPPQSVNLTRVYMFPDAQVLQGKSQDQSSTQSPFV
jgi:hypothetical protein